MKVDFYNCFKVVFLMIVCQEKVIEFRSMQATPGDGLCRLEVMSFKHHLGDAARRHHA